MSDTREYLQQLMSRYTVDNVEDPIAFRDRIDEFLAMDDWEMEGYTEDEKDVQREKSIKFEWGHNHDFGKFQIDGVLGDRHIDLLATFIDDFGLPKDLTGKSVLDVGVWCGGTSLLLAAMGARVYACEEVVKYADCTRFLAHEFGVQSPPPWEEETDGTIHCTRLSVYDKAMEGLNDKIDYIIFPGVLYHLSDPILALRILFNALKDGGELFIESVRLEKREEINLLEYKGSKSETNNWFVPTPKTLLAMLEDVGFEDSRVQYSVPKHYERMFAVTKRTEWKPMKKCGLSRRVR